MSSGAPAEMPGSESGMSAEASGLARVFQSAGDQTIYEAEPPYRFASVPLAAPVPDAERLTMQPSRMLRTYFEIVPFTGRETELAHLAKWRDTSDETSVQLIFGPGGQGKTRLATHLARMWSQEGWMTLKAFPHDDPGGPEAVDIALQAGMAGMLIIADYAERWEMTDLLALLRHTANQSAFPTRLLLLARPAGTWWQTLAYRIERAFDIPAGAMFLPPLGETPEDRMELFRVALDRFAYLLNVANPYLIRPPPGIAADNRYSLVLTTHMAALAAVLAYARGDTPPRDPAELSAFLLAREREHWYALYRRRDDPMRTAPHAMGQAVYTANLTGPLEYSDGLIVLGLAHIESREEPGQVLRDHAICYPPHEQSNFLEPLYPDRLGEDFVALSTPGHNNPIYPADPWTIGALVRLLSSSLDKNKSRPPWANAAMGLLTEIGSRWPHVASMTWAGELRTGKHHRRL
jgi:hypothetical protein